MLTKACCPGYKDTRTTSLVYTFTSPTVHTRVCLRHIIAYTVLVLRFRLCRQMLMSLTFQHRNVASTAGVLKMVQNYFVCTCFIVRERGPQTPMCWQGLRAVLELWRELWEWSPPYNRLRLVHCQWAQQANLLAKTWHFSCFVFFQSKGATNM